MGTTYEVLVCTSFVSGLVMARGEGMAYRSRKYLHRHRWTIAAATTVLAVLFTALGVVGWQAQRAMREAGRAQAMQGFVADLFESAGTSSASEPIDLRKLLDMGIVRGERSLARQPQARAELYGVVARLRLGLGDYREANTLLDKQDMLLANLPDAPVSLRLEAVTLRGNAYRQLGNLPGCLQAMQRMEGEARREEERLPTQVAAFYSQQGRCYQELDQSTLANRLYMRSLQLRRKVGDDVGVAENLLDIAKMHAADGAPEVAVPILGDALAELRRKVGDRHPLVIDMLRSLCALDRATDQLDDAVRHCRESQSLAEDLHGRDHRASIDANRQLAALYVDLGRFGQAESIFLQTFGWMRARHCQRVRAGRRGAGLAGPAPAPHVAAVDRLRAAAGGRGRVLAGHVDGVAAECARDRQPGVHGRAADRARRFRQRVVVSRRWRRAHRARLLPVGPGVVVRHAGEPL